LPLIWFSLGEWKWNCFSSNAMPSIATLLPGSKIHLDRVPVVDHFVATRLVVELDGLQFGIDGAGNVDRRLVPARARCELRLQGRPLVRSMSPL